MAYTKIAYEPHPVAPERKRELNAQGFRIVDIAFAPVVEKAAEVEAPAPAPAPQPRQGRKAKDAE